MTYKIQSLFNHAILSIGLRPFFLLTALIAVFVPMYFVCVMVNGYPFPGELLDPVSWHGHELIFGLVPALLSGFLLTSSANWTGTKPLSGAFLLLLVLIWIATRFFFFFQPSKEILTILGPATTIFLNSLMWVILKGNRNRLIVCSLLSIFTIVHFIYLGDMLWQFFEAKDLSVNVSSSIVASFLIVFSGRLIPFFTNSRLKLQLLKGNEKFDFIIILLLIATSFIDSLMPQLKFLSAFSFLFISTLLIYRCYKFYHRKIWIDHFVYGLHLANFWLPAFTLMKALTLIFPDLDYGRPEIHALYTGALALFAIIIMSRASLGHTGRAIKAIWADHLIFHSILIGALLRVLLPIINKETINISLHFSMGFWTLGFLIFSIRFAKIYFTPRADGL